jgi:cobalt/nickel transport system permease protein
VHIPDGFVDLPTSVGAMAVAGAGLKTALKRSSEMLDERRAPLAGLVAAFVFAAQMLNFPVAAGTSGHLIGGVLAAVLIGPWAGAICVTVVLLVQTLFADGGLTAIGLNVVNMALVSSLGGFAVFAILRLVLPRTRAAVALASGLAAGVSVVLASIAFVIEYALGGTTGISVGAVAASVVSIHALIGIGEGLITALTVSTVLSVRPDLVYGARDLASSTQSNRRASVVEGA